MMNPELKAKWVEALRSGKYAQTKNSLRKADGMCCIGVLADVIDPSKWTEGDPEFAFGNEQCTEMLSEVTLREAGLSLWDAKNLATMNDRGNTFREIASYIEANL